MSERMWLKGDTHFHTTNSDGKLPFEQLVAKCKQRGLDWMIITDHNYYTLSHSLVCGDFLVIPGEEYTGNEGHVNFWGSGLPKLPEGRPTEFEQYVQAAQRVKEAGGTVSVNHPFCKKCGWHMDLEDFDMDCVEVWNAPMHIDNMTNLKWWHGQLLKGRRVHAVGGSDYHCDYYVTNLIASPTTYVYAEDKTEEAILAALRAGHSFITNTPGSTKLFLSCGKAYPGCTVTWKDGIRAAVRLDKLKKGHTLRIWNNDTVIFEYKAKRTGEFSKSFAVPEKGFVRAEVVFEYGLIGKKVFSFVDSLIVPEDKGLEVPELAYCITNPIYFE